MEPVELVGLVSALGALRPGDDAARVDVLRVLEQVKCAAAGGRLG